MAELSWQRPGWRGWPWVRRALFLLPLAGVAWILWVSIVESHIDVSRLVVLSALMCWLAFGRRPWLATAVFLAAFVVGFIALPGDGLGWADGPAWILATIVVLDANSRSPAWPGLVATAAAALARVPQIFGGDIWDIGDTKMVMLALVGATLIGQLIRGAFAAGRASEDAAEARRLVERLELRHAVHDSGSARLAQLMMLTRALRERPELPSELRADVDLMVDVATAGAQELRSAMQPRADEPAALAREWRRSLEVLGSAGFEVVDAAPSLPGLDSAVEREAVRVVREATSNICKHGASGGRVVAASSLGAGTMTLSWLSDHDGRNAEPGGGLGLAGMAERAKRLGGSVQAALEDGCFRLRVTLPRPADA